MTRTIHDIQNEIVYCPRCGIATTAEQVYKRKIRNVENYDYCRDCRDTRTEIRRDYGWVHPVLGKIKCWLWTGELNDDWWPIDEQGNLFRPGERLCGLKDCVRLTHVIEPEVKTVSPIDLILGMHEMQQYNKRNTKSQVR
jgi:hypothetical protein